MSDEADALDPEHVGACVVSDVTLNHDEAVTVLAVFVALRELALSGNKATPLHADEQAVLTKVREGLEAPPPRHDYEAGYEAAMGVLARTIHECYMQAAMAASHAPRAKEMFDRMREPKVGDLVIEVSSMHRREWPESAIGVLREIVTEPTMDQAQWAEVCEYEQEKYDRLRELGPPPAGYDWTDEFLLSRGPRKATDPIPTEDSYVIEALLGPEPVVTWGNARFVSAPIGFDISVKGI
jgi:hypothetical protein